MIAIIDYDAGNIRSVEKACVALGRDARVTSDPEEILSAEIGRASCRERV